MMHSWVRCLAMLLAISLAYSSPLSFHDPDSHPLADLGQRLISHSSLLEPRSQDPRFPIPTQQDIEAIKKVAQILVMLGQQRIKRNKEKSGQSSRIDLLNSIVDTLRSLRLKSARSQKHKYVIPAIVGGSGAPHTSSSPSAEEEIPNDPVEV